MNHPTTPQAVFRDIVRNPGRYFIRRWNWKAAVMSSMARGLVFFFVNFGVSLAAATGAMATEMAYRFLAAGLYGALTQAFRHVEPYWKAMICTMLLLPFLSHSLEFTIHFIRGTERLGWSILFSVIFTACTTLFNLFAMRRGILVVDGSGSSLLDDFRALPGVLLAFFRSLGMPLKQLTQFLWTRIEQCNK